MQTVPCDIFWISLRDRATVGYYVIEAYPNHNYAAATHALDLQESIDRFRGPLTGLMMSWGASAVDAVELAQDSLADAYLQRDSCRGDVGDPLVFGRWLRGIAKNKYRNWARNYSRRERLARSITSEQLDQVAADATNEDERLSQLRAAIDGLPKKQRQVVIMHYLDETSVANVAALLSITPKSVEGRLYQARKRLREQLTQTSSSAQVIRALLL